MIDDLNRWDNRAHIDDIKQSFDYDPITGILTNRTNRCKSRKGEVSGYLNSDGYWELMFRGRKYRATHIIWALYYGRWPNYIIDHKDTNSCNNSISNLREANKSQNARNSPVRSDSSTGVKGVFPKRNRFYARIKIGTKLVYLGTFDTKEEAKSAYDNASLRRDAEFHKS